MFLIRFNPVFRAAHHQFRRGVKQSAQLPAEPVDATPPARVGKRGALSVPRLGEGSNAVPAPVRSIKFEAQGPMRPLRRSRDAPMTTAV